MGVYGQLWAREIIVGDAGPPHQRFFSCLHSSAFSISKIGLSGYANLCVGFHPFAFLSSDLNMTESTASRKRQRTDEPAVKPEPSSDKELPTLLPLHYDDGNVVIEARAHFSAAELEVLARDGCNVNQSLADALKSIPQEGLDGLVEYKVHRGILASHSAVFANHFRGIETILSGCEEEYEGGNVLTLSDDRSGLDAFLKAMYLPE